MGALSSLRAQRAGWKWPTSRLPTVSGPVSGARKGGGVTTVLFHADGDAFLASVEQRDDDRLRGRPLAVGEQVVACASYEARALGVHAGMPLGQVRQGLEGRNRKGRGDAEPPRALPCARPPRDRA